jgi:protoporphyrinogen oxidase
MSSISSSRKTAVVVGAGPAGLTAALELLRRSDITPVVLESDGQVGGISKTINHRGNRMDLGGHRFFSKSEWVMRWWQDILPVAWGNSGEREVVLKYQGQSHKIVSQTSTTSTSDAVMLVRRRLSRIFYRRRFFNYPLTLTFGTLKNLGIFETLKVGMSYGSARFAARTPEVTLEDFLVNRFGSRLYHTFFKDYTEKVWGVPCYEISAEWGAQRIKGLSIAKALAHALKRPFQLSSHTQKGIETSLIEQFLYPKLGPGQMWEEVARQVSKRGGRILLQHKVVGIERSGFRVTSVKVLDLASASVTRIPCDHLISTMPVRDLTSYLEPPDERIARIAERLPYRDFMTAGLLLRRMKCPPGTCDSKQTKGMPPDNWIYIQEPEVRLGRLQIFNNWSPALVADPETIWLGLEYFCREGDGLWSMENERFIDFAARELEKIGLIDRTDVIDGTVVRVRDAYPAYFGAYAEMNKVRAFLDQFPNLYPVGRNGMHRYNNQDHSMLAADSAVSSILKNGSDKSAIWQINADGEYHENLDSPGHN